MKEYFQYLNEEDYPWQKQKRQWVTVDVHTLDTETLNALYKMYHLTYKKDGIDNYTQEQLTDKEYLKSQGYKAVWFIDVDKDKYPDAFIIYKEVGANKKISLAGSEMYPPVRIMLKNKIAKLLRSSGWYLEASKRIEEFCKKNQLPFVEDPKDIKKLIDKDFTYIKDGYYKRALTNSDIEIVKRIYGKPIL